MRKFTSLLTVFLSFNVYAQYGVTSDMFQEPFDTGSNMTVAWIIESSSYNFFEQFEGGHIGVFYVNDFGELLGCGGYVEITNMSEGDEMYVLALPFWGDDSSTDYKDGLSNGEIPTMAILTTDQQIIHFSAPEFSGYFTNGVSSLTLFENVYGPSGCTDFNACNALTIYDNVYYEDDESCHYPEPWFDCEGVCLDSNNNSMCDIDENPGCMDPLYVNYDVNATVDDGSCSETWENSYNDLVVFSADQSSEISALLEVKNQLESELNDVYYQLDTTLFALQVCMESPQCEEIVINIEEGWNIFGYTSSLILDIGSIMGPYDDKIYIIKDNNGDPYWPEYGFNGIGDFTPGAGYQLKASEPFSILFED